MESSLLIFKYTSVYNVPVDWIYASDKSSPHFLNPNKDAIITCIRMDAWLTHANSWKRLFFLISASLYQASCFIHDFSFLILHCHKKSSTHNVCILWNLFIKNYFPCSTFNKVWYFFFFRFSASAKFYLGSSVFSISVMKIFGSFRFDFFISSKIVVLLDNTCLWASFR